MFINIKQISTAFSEYPASLKSLDSTFCITGFCRISPGQTNFNPHILYVTDDVFLLETMTNDVKTHVLLCADEQISLDELPLYTEFLIVYSCTLQKAEEILGDFFDICCGKALLSDSLLNILFSECGIQAMVDEVYHVFHNPIAVFDAGYQLIAANFEDMANRPFAKNIMENHGFSDTEFNMVNQQNHIHKRVMKSSTPLKVHHKEIGFDQLICSINPEKDYGHIVLTASNQPLQEHDASFLIVLQKAIDQQIKKDEFIRNNRGFQYEYFLRDILDGKIAVPREQSSLLDYTSSEFHGTLYCLVVETARSSDTLSTLHIRSNIENCFPAAKTLLYNGEIVAIIKKENASSMTEPEKDQLKKICKEHGLFAGLSNEFCDITTLPHFYTQALRAIELGTCRNNVPSLFIYLNYYQEHIFNLFTQKESPEVFCHPKLLYLFDYDKKHNSNLAETLYMFLAYERNHSAAAKAMYIHRNTFVYRMKKIDELLEIDYENYEERQYLILSYELLAKSTVR